MTSKVFTLDTQPGIQRDGTVFDKMYYNDGEWVRFQRGRPRKIGGFRVISDQLTGPSRGIWVNPQNAFTSIFSGYNNGIDCVDVGLACRALADLCACSTSHLQHDEVDATLRAAVPVAVLPIS